MNVGHSPTYMVIGIERVATYDGFVGPASPAEQCRAQPDLLLSAGKVIAETVGELVTGFWDWEIGQQATVGFRLCTTDDQEVL